MTSTVPLLRLQAPSIRRLQIVCALASRDHDDHNWRRRKGQRGEGAESRGERRTAKRLEDAGGLVALEIEARGPEGLALDPAAIGDGDIDLRRFGPRGAVSLTPTEEGARLRARLRARVPLFPGREESRDALHGGRRSASLPPPVVTSRGSGVGRNSGARAGGWASGGRFAGRPVVRSMRRSTMATTMVAMLRRSGEACGRVPGVGGVQVRSR